MRRALSLIFGVILIVSLTISSNALIMPNPDTNSDMLPEETINTSEVVLLTDDESEILAVLEDFFERYMDGQKAQTHPDFSDIVIDNSNTQLYSAMINYDIDSNGIYGTIIDSYSLEIKPKEISIQGETASADIYFCSSHHYQEFSDDQISSWKLLFNFQLVKVGDDWKIQNIDGNDHRFKLLEEELNLPATHAAYEGQTPQEILDEKIVELQNSDLDLLLYGNENSEESQRKLADAQSASVASVSRPFVVSSAVSYSNTYALETNEANLLFYYADEDCTNFVSQCVWAGYGGWVKNNNTTNENNIKNHYRMYYTGRSNWYENDWFGHGSGGSGAWEKVNMHCSFVDQNTGLGPSGEVYNNGYVYTNLGSSSISVGETLQFKNGAPNSDNSDYEHSVFVVKINSSASGYNKILCNAHNSEYLQEPVTTWTKYFGGSNCYMRSIVYGQSTFSE